MVTQAGGFTQCGAVDGVGNEAANVRQLFDFGESVGRDFDGGSIDDPPLVEDLSAGGRDRLDEGFLIAQYGGIEICHQALDLRS